MTIALEQSYNFVKSVLDSVTDHIAVIDSTGCIQLVNASWKNFGKNNSCMMQGSWVGVNYIDECVKGAKKGDDFADRAEKGIRDVIENRLSLFYFEYPCHSPEEERWFMMRVTPFFLEGKRYFVICHQNITERKLAEQEISNLAKIDPLTDIPNRRTFNDFLQNEWKRLARSKGELALAFMDLDHFKLINDTYGHHAGDNCLSRIGSLLKEITNRPGDLCARYGGEEFAIIWSDTNLVQARYLAGVLLEKIAGLHIANEKSPVKKYLTASIGLAAMIPSSGLTEETIVYAADEMLYKAKKNGRDRVEF